MARGISNTSVDLIYNYPGQTDGQLVSDLHTIRALDVAGVSIYSLMLHEKTPLYRRLSETERQALLDLRREKALFDRILDTLGADGYRMLELTKLVKGGRDRYDYMEIRHSGGSCIALGRGAGGNIENYFYHNAADAPVISERIPFSASGRVFVPAYRRLDALVYAMQKGVVDFGVYSAQIDVDLKTLFSAKLERLCARRLRYDARRYAFADARRPVLWQQYHFRVDRLHRSGEGVGGAALNGAAPPQGRIRSDAGLAETANRCMQTNGILIRKRQAIHRRTEAKTAHRPDFFTGAAAFADGRKPHIRTPK